MAGAALNAEQLVAVDHDLGRVVLSAIAGSGKTLVVIRRIAHLIKVRGVDPSRILAVTFSNEAADELEARLTPLIGNTGARIGTIHSLARHIIMTENPEYRDWFVDADSYQLRGHARELLKEQEFKRYSRVLKPQLVVAFMGLYQNKGLRLEEHVPQLNALAAACFEISPRNHDMLQMALKVCARLEESAEARRELTFDTMLVKAEAMLRNDDAVRARWSEKWDYVIQDECQDQSPIQAALLELLTRDKQNYMQVGDVMQSIYEFRGAEPRVFAGAERENKTLYLSMNYRSAREVVVAANSILKTMQTERPPMVCASGRDGAVNIVCCVGARDEAEHAADLIARHAPGDSAVLARTGSGLVLVEHALRARGIPVVNLNAIKFWTRREVEGPVSYLRFAMGDWSVDTIWLSMQVPLRYIKKDDASAVHVSLAHGARIKASDVIAAKKRPALAVQNVAGWEESMRAVTLSVRAGKGPAAALRCVTDTPKFMNWLADEEADDVVDMQRGDNVAALLSFAEAHKDVRDFLLWYAAEAQEHDRRHNAKAKESEDSVTLSSIHRAKGREWRNVVVIGCNEGVIPHIKSKCEAEELRLFYVATTRARETLTYLCSSVGGLRPTYPSSFLDIVGEDCGEDETQ